MNENRWTISGLKENAKSVLKDFYWKAVLASLIFALLTGGMGNSSSSASSASKNWQKFKQEMEEQMDSGNSTYSWDEDNDSIFDMSLTTEDGRQIHLVADASASAAAASAVEPAKTASDDYTALFAGIMAVVFVIVLIAAVIGSLYTIFVGNIIQVGYRRYHLDARYERSNCDVMKVFSAFKNGYGSVAKTMFFKDLYVFLWSLLFIIPGIIKSYEYFLVPYILAENPTIDRDRAFEISRKTMDGEKMNCFLLGLSFIGWFFLAGLVPLGIGNIFVNPYLYATYAEFYCCMKAKAFANGIALPGELADDYSMDNSFDQSYPTSSSFDSYNTSSQDFGASRNSYQNTTQTTGGMQPYQPYSDFGNNGYQNNTAPSAPSQPADSGYPSGTMDEIGDIDTSALDKTDDDMGL